jgi:hypothetical protein
VWSLLVTADGSIVAGVENQPLQLIDRKKKIIKQIGNPHRYHNYMSHLLGYSNALYPFFLVKNEQAITVVNAHTHNVTNVCDCEYDDWPLHTAIQYVEGNNLKLLTLQYNVNESKLMEVQLTNRLTTTLQLRRH